MKSSNVPPLYLGKVAVCAATGPSLNIDVVNILAKYRQKFVLFGCNDAYKLLPDLDVHYACDTAWWALKGSDAIQSINPKAYLWTQSEEAAGKYGLNYIRGDHLPGFSTKTNLIHYGNNSGYQQINLALHYGIEKIILVGYNMQKVGGLSHFFGEHPKGLHSNSNYLMFLQHYETIPKDTCKKIINCTKNTSLNKFKISDLEEELLKL